MSSPLPYELDFGNDYLTLSSDIPVTSALDFGNDYLDYGTYGGLDSDWTPVELQDGSIIYQANGSYIDAAGNPVTADGTPTTRVEGTTYSPTTPSILDGLSTAVKNAFLKKDANGNPIAGQYDIGKILTAGGGALGGLAGLLGANKPTTTPSGYQGGIPQLTAVRTALEQPARTPYTGQPAMGRRYFTDTQYVTSAQAEATSQSQATQADIISQQQAERDQELARRKAQSVDTRPIYPGPDTTGLTGGPGMPLGGWRGSDIPYRPDLNKKFEEFGFDKGLTDYLNQLRKHDQGDYFYDPATTMFFSGNGKGIASLQEMQDRARGDFNTMYHYVPDFKPINPRQLWQAPVQPAPIGQPELAPTPPTAQEAPPFQNVPPTIPQEGKGYNLLSYDDWSKTSQNPYYNKPAPSNKNNEYYSTLGQIQNYHNYLNNQEVPKDFASDGQRVNWINTKNNYNQYASNLSDEYQKNNPRPKMMFAQGGLMGLAKGRYLQGSTDGMADELRTSIEGKQAAALSHGEFVVPADVVSHLGNGNSDAGAKKLYQMMDRIRMARTGTKKQGKEINPDKFMPGGKVGYAQGGIAKFVEGGSTSRAPSGAAIAAGVTGTESSLSNWAGPYVTNMLAQGQALANQPYQAYTGQLTAGTSPLQQQAFNQAANLQVPSSIGQAAQTAQNISQQAQNLGYSPATFGNQFTAPSAYQAGTFDTDMFGTQQAQQYMNPYLQQALDPQLAEARRQSQITQAQNAGKLTGAGAYGGGRQAIMDAETQRNLGTNLANITGQGYATAFDKAQAAFNADQARRLQAQQAGEQSRQFGAGQAMTGAQLGAQYGLAGQQATEASRQFGANYGLQGLNTALQGAQTQGQLGTAQNQAGLANLSALSGLGTTQRGIEAEAVAADRNQFEEERLNPYKMVQFQQSLLSGLPLAAQTYNTAQPSWLQSLAQGTTFGANSLDAILRTLGLSSGQTGTTSADQGNRPPIQSIEYITKLAGKT